MAEYIIEMRHVSKHFPGVKALDDVSISLKPGEILAICGENGAGKSTLMKVLSGSYTSKEYSGEIWFDGSKVHNMNVQTARQLGIEMIYQEINVMLDGTLEENLFVGNLPGKGALVDYATLHRETQKVLDTIEIHASPQSIARPLNSGQLQMLSIMRAVIRKPKVLVLDEPTSALTDREVGLLFSIMNKLRAQGVGCIYISHKLDEVFTIADRIVVMRDGQVISDRLTSETNNDKLVEEMVGRKMQGMYPPRPESVSSDVVLSVRHLSVPHPTIVDRNIVEDISFELHRGEILGLGGLVGAGRSESLGAVFGQITRDVTKEVEIEGKRIQINRPKDAIAQGLGFVTEERKKSGFVQLMSIMQNLTLVNLNDLPGRFLINRKAEEESARSVFQRLRVKAPNMNVLMVALSGGNQQKVVLGKWLLKNPQILFMDEPTKGIDVGAKAEIYNIMRELTKQGVSIIMASSDLPELVNVSDRILVLSSGKIQGELTGDRITQENVMHLAIL